jgi:hypothetical protein
MEAKGAQDWQPVNRQRTVSAALQAYAAMTTNASRGAVRDVTWLNSKGYVSLIDRCNNLYVVNLVNCFVGEHAMLNSK